VRRVLVCGGRNFDNMALLRETLDRLHEENEITCIIEGGARGADALAAQWSRLHGVTNRTFAADWSIGRRAGPERNARMLAEARPHLVVAFAGGAGTTDMCRRAEQAGVPVLRVGW
jgi:hypothetical protein